MTTRKKKPAPTTKRTKRAPVDIPLSEAPPIALEDFAVLFDIWDGTTGVAVSTPKEAAIRAAYSVCVAHAGQPGTVMVSASDASAARQTLDLLKSYFTDRPELAPMLKRVVQDGIELYGAQKILITTSPRSPAGLLSCINIEPAEVVDLTGITSRDMTRAILMPDVHDDPSCAGAIESAMGLPANFFQRMSDRAEEQQAAEEERRHRAFLANMVKPKPPEYQSETEVVPTCGNTGEPSPPGIDGVDYYSPQWEADNMMRKIFGGSGRQHRNPKIIRRRPPR